MFCCTSKSCFTYISLKATYQNLSFRKTKSFAEGFEKLLKPKTWDALFAHLPATMPETKVTAAIFCYVTESDVEYHRRFSMKIDETNCWQIDIMTKDIWNR